MLKCPVGVQFGKDKPNSAWGPAAMIGVITSLLVLVTPSAYGDWKPPENPNPDKILTEAQDDAAAGRYADALAKHVWFHENALKYAPAMYGVRLSFALSYWASLAAVYPPALARLKAVRDGAGTAVREGRDPRHAFHDFASINRTLREQEQTKNLFLWLDVNKPDVARQNFDIAEPALVESKEYRLCGKYLDPDRSLKRIVDLYRETAKMAPQLEGEGQEYAVGLREHAAKSFANSVATLVALLALNDRPDDAARIAAEALKESDDRELKEMLGKARNGELPPPWP